MNKNTRAEKSWIIYDIANSAFVLVIITTIMPIFFKEFAAKGMDTALSTSNWAFANAAASLLLAISAPFLGTFADYQGFKKKFFLAFLVTGVSATFLLTTVQEGAWIFCLLIFIFSKIGFAGANIFYDAFLPDVTSKVRMDRISSQGFAWGYIGSVVPFLIIMALIFLGMKSNGSSALPPMQAKIGFLIVGGWWLLFSIPFIKNVEQSHYIPRSAHPFTGSLKRLVQTFHDIRRYRQPFLFLIAYFLYIDGVDTIITMATAYGIEIGLNTTMLILAILMIQIVAFPCALFYGRMADRFNGRAMLLVGIGVYVLITFLAFLLPSFPSLQSKTIMFWILAFLVATSMGGIQALSRSFFGKLIPAERSAEFFGFYNICGRFAAIIGPLMMGIFGRLTGDSRYGVLSILLLLIAGGFALTKVEPDL
ncbi:MAG: MFS transporter [Proteobacteria bacterium]|nr:MFS transporter [Pseudomonadota bacterium]MBU1715093.1 MFS transporter [Pseudomonadota bacterium]